MKLDSDSDKDGVDNCFREGGLVLKSSLVVPAFAEHPSHYYTVLIDVGLDTFEPTKVLWSFVSLGLGSYLCDILYCYREL